MITNLTNEQIYYNIDNDIKDNPDINIFIIYGGRFRGKTYGTLRKMIADDSRFIYMTRTKEQTKLLYDASTDDEDKEGATVSPFKALNRDFDWNITAQKMNEYLGGFFNDNKLAGYICAFTSVSKYKTMGLDDAEYMIFDEFIPNVYDRVMKGEGLQLLDMYLTISRDRELKGKPPLKLICLANATMIANPVFRTFEIVDDVAELNLRHEGVIYPKPHMLVRKIAEIEEVSNSVSIYDTMRGTKWADMAFKNQFAYDDFSHIRSRSLKGFTPICSFKKAHIKGYVYYSPDKGYHVSSAKTTAKIPCYDLDTESGKIAFYCEDGARVRLDTIEGRATFDKYSYYDIVMNDKQR